MPETKTKKTRIGSMLVRAVLIVLLVWTSGFAWFASKVTSADTNKGILVSDGIVVLTGGQNRIQTGIDLLTRQKANRLLITGVNENTSDTALMQTVNNGEKFLECCIDIDRSAINTPGNADQTRLWATSYGFKKLIIVTSNYHMPRSLLLMQRAMPDIQFTPVPVAPPDLEGKSVANVLKFRIMLVEYTKYLLARFRIFTLLSSLISED